MSLRTRLWLVLAALFLLPLVVSGLVLLLVVPNVSAARVAESADTGAMAVGSGLRDECRLLGLAARNAALEAAGAQDPARGVEVAVADGSADYAGLLDQGGSVVASAGTPPAGAPDALPSCSAGRVDGPVLAERVAVSGVEGMRVAVAARVLRGPVLDDLAARAGSGAEVVLLRRGEVVATTAAGDVARAVARAAAGPGQPAALDGWTVQQAPAGLSPYTVVVAVPDTGYDLELTPLVLIVVATALAAGLLVGAVARDLSRPFQELTEAAERVAHGDLDTLVQAGEDGEAGRLGSALNAMTDELRRNLAELERSRQELRDSLERIGDTLSATHDLDKLLQVVLDTACATVGGTAGVALHRSGDRLELVAEHALHDAGLPAPTAVQRGLGLLGRVVATGMAMRGPLGDGPGQLPTAPGEPGIGHALAVPLRTSGAVVGVLALYRGADERPFDDNDEDALGTLAGQASIALENVHLHREAERLSTTDPLTGVWNFRYLSMSLAREIERSTRFDRPLAVLMLDLDHFKQVNDVYGHARGDAVLRELAERVQEQIREVDTFARYGGEEFVVVLPETTLEGAAQLAERICVAVRREPFRSEGEEPLTVTVSIGGAAFPEHGSSPATLMRAADKALYEAKGQGRDRWHVPGAVHAAPPPAAR